MLLSVELTLVHLLPLWESLESIVLLLHARLVRHEWVLLLLLLLHIVERILTHVLLLI